jgi:hypothetical protein
MAQRVSFANDDVNDDDGDGGGDSFVGGGIDVRYHPHINNTSCLI